MQGTFRGEKTLKIDAKGRVSIPSSFRKVLDAGDPNRESGADPILIIVHGDPSRNYLEGYSQAAMDKVEAKIRKMKSGDAKRLMTRLYLTQTTEMAVDSTGRIVLPKDLRDRLALGETGDLTFAGAGDTFQIWNDETYKEENGIADISSLDVYEEGMDMNDLLDLLTED